MNSANQPARCRKQIRLRLLPACLVLLLATAAPARAARLDEALLKAAPSILEQLKKDKIRNVGVLPFQVRKGPRKPSYTAAPLSTTLPGRLENALIMRQSDDEESAIGIIRDAAGSANDAGVGSYLRSAKAFKKLFQTTYNLAWGNWKVRPDAFLTGVVVNAGNHSKTTIQLQLVTPDSWEDGSAKPTSLGKPIEVKTDRSLLRDLGYNYLLLRSVAKRGVPEDDRDQFAIEEIQKQEESTKAGKAVTSLEISGFLFELRYNNVKQRLRPLPQSEEGAKALQYQADPPKAGTKFALALKRMEGGDRKLGAVLKVNGLSIWQDEDDEPIRCRKWVYSPEAKGIEDVYRGVYTRPDGPNEREFNVLSAADSARRASELGERAGWIDIDVFVSSETENGSDQQQLKISARGLARSDKKFATLKALRSTLRKANNFGTVNRRGFVEPEREPSREVKILEGELPNPVHLGGVSIRYYDRTAEGEDE